MPSTMEQIDELTAQHDDLLDRRINLLLELDNIAKEMDRILLKIAHLQEEMD